MRIRTLLLSALLFSSCPSAFAQDAFDAGGDDRCDTGTQTQTMAPRLVGYTNGTVSPPKRLCPFEYRKLSQLQEQLDEALRHGNLNQVALLSYKMYSLTDEPTFRTFAELAAPDAAIEDVDITQVDEQDMGTVRRILELQGKSDNYIAMLERKITGDRMVDAEIAGVRGDAVSERNVLLDEKRLGKSGLRKFTKPNLIVSIPEATDSHQKMVVKCIRRALDQISAATGRTLTFREDPRAFSADLRIDFERKSCLWYEYQRHGTATLCYPLQNSVAITEAQMKVPMMATMHRKVSEAECQEYCLREIARAVGYTWHPSSLERFTQDFRADIDAVRHDKIRKYKDDLQLADLMGPAYVRGCVQKALEQSGDAFHYYAGLAYLARGDREMARRNFCNASTFFIEQPSYLHGCITRMLGSGDITGAELVTVACINDDESNDTDTPSYKEFERVKRCNLGGADGAVPVLSASDAKILARIYSKENTPAASIESTPKSTVKASAAGRR